MSLLVTSADGYEATISGWDAGITKAWAFAWFKTSDGSAHRGLVQLTENNFDGTQDYLSLALDGSICITAGVSTANVDVVSPDPGDFYFWNGAQQNKWTVGCAVFDTTATSADVKCIFGRAAATAKPATTQSNSNDLTATSAALTRIRVLADRRRIINGSTTDDDPMSSIKAAYIAVGKGDVPTQSQIQDCIDGMHPADLPGVWEYWDLTDSGAGLVGALEGVTLAPFGGTTDWDGADNPTVDAPSSGDTTPPVITGPSGATGSTSSISIAENTTTVFDFNADESVTWDLNGGADVAFFSINSSTGVLSFIAPPNYEDPLDDGANNTYVVGVRATDGASNATTQTCTVTVTDVAIPTAPSIGTTTSITDTGATANWTDNSSNETGFEVEIETPSGANNWTNASTAASNPTAANATSLAVNGLTAGTEYRLRVRANGAEGDSAWSTSSAFTTIAYGVLEFSAAGMEFGGRVGADIDTMALDAEVDYRLCIFADGPTTGNPVHTTSTLTTGTDGKLDDFSHSSLTTGTTYRVVAIRQSDGEAAVFRMEAA